MFVANYLFAPYLEEGEKILKVFHRHVFVMLPDLFRVLFFGVAIPVFLFYLFPDFMLFFVIWICVTLVRLVYILFNWYHDALLVTTVSLISVQWNGFFDRMSSRLEYHQVDGTSSEIRGFRRTLFNYGNITIQHGSGIPIVLRDAVNPKSVEKQIMLYQDRFVSEQSLKDSDQLKDLLSAMLKHHVKTGGVPEKD
jgi:hypothetical protein